MHWIAIATVVLVAYALVDLIATDAGLIRNLPKLAWLAVVLLLPLLGSLAWLLLGRPHGAALLPGTAAGDAAGRGRGRSQPLAPDDDPEFLRRLRDPRDES